MTNEEAVAKIKKHNLTGSIRYNSESAYPYKVIVYCEGELCIGLGDSWESAFKESYKIAKALHETSSAPSA